MKVNSVYYPHLFDYSHKIEIYYGSAGSGKSHFITQKWILKLLHSPRKLLVLRKNQVTLSDSVVSLFKTILEEEGIPYTYRSMDKHMWIGQSEILFKGTDHIEKILSIAGITDVWVEEAYETSPSEYDQLGLRLRALVEDSQTILSFNPCSKTSYLYRYFFDEGGPEYIGDTADLMILKTTYKDNLSFLSQNFLEKLEQLRKSNPTYYQVFALGLWGSLSKLIFPLDTWSVKKLDIPPKAKRIFGLDLGWNDPSALVCIAVWDNYLYIYDEFVRSECLSETIAPIIKSKCGNSIVFADCAAASQIAELNKLGLYNVRPCKKKPGDVLAGIDQIKAYDLVIDPHCMNCINDFSMYAWKQDKQTGLYVDEPERGEGASHQNCCDATRYAMQALGSSVKTVNIKLAKGL